MTNKQGARSSAGPQAATAGPATSVGAGQLSITVVYAEPGRVWQRALTVPAGTNVATVLELSGFARLFPDYPVDAPAVGVFGRRCQPDHIVSDADRIEIYRPLNYDPMESRRRRAEHRKAAAKLAAFRPRRVRDGKNS